MTSLLDDADHRTWLHERETAALSFAQASIRPEGGFHYLGADRRPLADRPPALFLTARMAWVSSAGVRDGIPGSERLLDHAMDSLLGPGAEEIRRPLGQPDALTRWNRRPAGSQCCQPPGIATHWPMESHRGPRT